MTDETREAPPTFAARVREIANFIAPTTVITALLIYFGAVYTDGRLAYYGIQLGLADLTNADLVLYGTEAIYVPVALLLLTVLIALGVHAGVTWLLARPGRGPGKAFTAATVAVLGVLVTARALIGILVPGVAAGEPTGFTPVALALGPLLLAYSAWIAGKVVAAGPQSPVRRWHEAGQTTQIRRVATVAVVVLVLTGLFWATNRFAFTLGLSRSYREAGDLAGAYRVVLDTNDPLVELPDGVTQTALDGGDRQTGFRYRYHGLRVVLESGDRLFLVPEQWTRNGRTLVVPYNDSVRIELIPPPKNLAPG